MIIEAKDKNQIQYLLNQIGRQRSLVKSFRAEMSEESDISRKDVFWLLGQDIWPQAVPSTLIFSSPEEFKLRAALILDKFFPSLRGKSFLDYGCGTDHVVNEARRRGADAKGYDFVASTNWSNCHTKLPNETFDFILMHDVLDHAIETPHVDIMKQVTAASHADTVLKVRIHPWTSRHGSHIYKFLNKAFVHMIFTDEELKALGYCSQNIPTIPLTNPLEHYQGLFACAGWKVVKSTGVFDEVEPFFIEQDEIKKRLTVPNSTLRISFLDYELRKS